MLNEGLYEQVISKALSSKLNNAEQLIDTGKLDAAEAPSILAKYIAEIVEKGLRQVESNDISEQLRLANKIVSTVAEVTNDEEFDGEAGFFAELLPHPANKNKRQQVRISEIVFFI